MLDVLKRPELAGPLSRLELKRSVRRSYRSIGTRYPKKSPLSLIQALMTRQSRACIPGYPKHA